MLAEAPDSNQPRVRAESAAGYSMCPGPVHATPAIRQAAPASGPPRAGASAYGARAPTNEITAATPGAARRYSSYVVLPAELVYLY